MGLESELQRQRGREEEVSVMRNGFEEQLERVRAEVDDWQRKFGEESLERRKAVAHTQSLERTNKVCRPGRNEWIHMKYTVVYNVCNSTTANAAVYMTVVFLLSAELCCLKFIRVVESFCFIYMHFSSHSVLKRPFKQSSLHCWHDWMRWTKSVST